MPAARTLQDLIDAGVVATGEEAVAVVQELVASADHEHESPPGSGPTPGDIRIGPDGVLRVAPATPLSVAGAAALLDTMLPCGAGVRVPGALRYTVARALGQVDAPSFGSVGEFSAALARHERRDRALVLRDLYSRAIADGQTRPDRDAAALPVVVTFGAGAVPGRRRERRRSAVSVSALRRELRAVEAELYRTRMQIQVELADRYESAPPLPATLIASDVDSRRPTIFLVIAALILSFLVGYAVDRAWQSTTPPMTDAQAVGRAF